MNRKYIIGGLVLFIAFGLPIIAVFGYEAYRMRDIDAEIIMRAPEKGNFTPRELTLPTGRPIRLRLRNTDTVAHGFGIPELEIDAGVVDAGEVTIVEFELPTSASSYRFYCTVWCGDYHPQMFGVINSE